MTEQNTSLAGKIIAFIGSGAMGGAMMHGLISQGLVHPQDIIATDTRQERGEELVNTHGIRFTSNNAEAAQTADVVILAIKPQVMPTVLDDINGKIQPESLVISIAAGIKIETMRDGCGHQNIVRSIPNTPAQIGAGMTAWVAAPQVTDEQRQLTTVILGALGETLEVDDEKFIDMATAINGSGPAYIFLILEALIDAGVHLGFSRAAAQKLAQQTMYGSLRYAVESGQHPADLRNQVTSPGGTTAAGLYALEDGRIRTVIANAVWAAYNRSRELGRDD